MVDKRLKELYEQYYLVVMDIAFKILQDYHLAQDICQDVFVHVTSEQLDKMGGSPKRIKRYLIVMAQNRAVDYIRMRKVRNEVSYQEIGDCRSRRDEIEQLEKSVDQRLLMKELFEKLKEFRPDWYEVLMRTEVYNCTVEEIAWDLNIPVYLVRNKLSRAKKWLSKKYRRRYEELK